MPIEQKYDTNWYFPTFFGFVGFVSGCTYNLLVKRPYYSGFHKHILSVIIASYLGYRYDQTRQRTLALRDAILYHYAELHPEDFPEKVRVKYKDTMEEWFPYR